MTERAHAVLSASGAHRWLTCPASALLEQEFEDSTSEAAREGTLAHELAELKVRNYFYTVDFGKRKLNSAIKKLKEHELWQDEMLGYTDTYLDYIKTAAFLFASAPYTAIEKEVYFSSYVPGGFGTADCILLGGDTLQIIDFKYGKGVPVSAEHNPQMLLYALGAYESYQVLYQIQNIKMSIVQPRLSDGISEWECSIEELQAFGTFVKERAALALSGDAEFHPDEKACRFCRAKAQCRARAEEHIRLAFFTDKKPPLISNEEVGQFLLEGQDVAKWLEDLKAYALKECLAGKEVPGWKAVEGRGSRDWTDMDIAFQRLQENGINETILWERKPLTLAQVEKIVGNPDFESWVGNLVLKNPGKPTLAKEADQRPAVTNKVSAAEVFQENPK